MENLTKTVQHLKRENRYSYFDEENRLRMKKFFYLKNNKQMKEPYMVSEITYEGKDCYEVTNYFAKNKGRKLRTIYTKNGVLFNKKGPALICYGADTESFKYYCKFYDERGLCRDEGPCKFKIMNNGEYEDAMYIFGGVEISKEQFEEYAYRVKNNYFDIDELESFSKPMLESILGLAKFYNAEALIKQIDLIEIVNKLEENGMDINDYDYY